jgi:hypothetical protein
MCPKRNGEARTHPATAVRQAVGEMLTLQAWQKPAGVEGIDCLKLLACVKQLSNLVSRVFNLLKYLFAGFLRVQYEDKQEIVSGSHSITGVHEVTDELARVETARSAETKFRARIQHDVDTRLVGAINNRRFLSQPVEKVPTSEHTYQSF